VAVLAMPAVARSQERGTPDRQRSIVMIARIARDGGPHLRSVLAPDVVEFSRTAAPIAGGHDPAIQGTGSSQNYPNPFNPTTRIQYTLVTASDVSLRVYNLLGQVVATLVSRRQDAGIYDVPFDASNLSSGVYFYRLEAGSFISMKRLVLIK